MQARQVYHPTDFSDRHWQRLLDYALPLADAFECAVPYPFLVQDLRRAPFPFEALEPLRPALIDRHVSIIRAGRTREFASQFLRFRMDAQVQAYIRLLPKLEAWTWRRGRPEDPCLLIGDVQLLSTESVDGRISLFVSPEERAALGQAGIRLLEPLGVVAEPWPTP